MQGIIYVGKETQDYCDDLHIIQRNQGMDFLIRDSVTSRKTVYTDDKIILLCQVFTAAYVLMFCGYVVFVLVQMLSEVMDIPDKTLSKHGHDEAE